MTKQNIIICTSVFFVLLFSFSFKTEETLNTKIEAVTIYINGAQINRVANQQLKAGQTTIECKGISPYINAQSLSVKGFGDFKILSTGVKTDFGLRKTDDAKTDSLNNIKLILKKQTDNLNAKLTVLTQVEKLVRNNSSLSTNEQAVSTENLKAMMNLYKADLLPVIVEKNLINNELDSISKLSQKIKDQMFNYNNKESLPKIILIEVEAKETMKAKFEISYFVEGASWQPNYDVRVNDLSQPIELTAKANVTQVTGEDWENVALTFSSGEPNAGGIAPELQPWYLNYSSRKRNYSYNNAGLYNPSVRKVTGKLIDEYGEPLSFANVYVDGTTVGAVTDINGLYSINIPIGSRQLTFGYVGYQTKKIAINKPNLNVKLLSNNRRLEEVTVRGPQGPAGATGVTGATGPRGDAGGVAVGPKGLSQKATYSNSNAQQTPTVLTFKVEERFTIPSNNSTKTINLAEYKVDATYTHYTVPKLEPTAYLIASLNNWSKYNLLQGEANIYFENTLITETIIDTQSFNDTLSISLGPDKNVAIKRVKNEDFCETSIFSANTSQSIGFNIDIRNNRKQLINLECYDQIPISEIDDIKIKTINISEGNLNEKIGIIKWMFDLMPDENKQLQLAYEVKYPKGKNVVLE